MRNSNPIQILVVDDEQSIRRLIDKELSSPERLITTAGTAEEAFARVRKKRFDVIVLDIQLPDGNGLELMERFQELVPGVEIILITGYGDIDSAVEAMKMSAYDYITKPFNLDRLELVVEKAFQRVCLQRENRLLRHKQGENPPHKLIGNTAFVEEVRYLIRKVAPTHVPVLITGESGTGKNVVSRNIHHQSQRADQPLITKNCGTLQKELILSELFGYRKGSFTGASESRDGLLALAHRGTLFLDEIGELPMEVQASLLRVLENQTYRSVGGRDEQQVDIRFIFATNRNLVEEVEAGRFSQALYHRLNVFNIELPPLRDRVEDIPMLVEYFRQKLSFGPAPCRVSRRAMQCLLAYNWPGNIRELQNVIERGIILSENDLITERGLPHELVESTRETATADTPFVPLSEMEKAHILRVLKYVKDNRAKAAEILGIGRKTLYRKLKTYEIEEGGM
ncbi:sigma-54-dependent Fis family transcriptional re gulator [Desulfonema ishimotonii]|uniref:Sigma-54-dependent Fis family transcriptional re gulator n=1 Tax=Desulfonema ishimotonii TaxID=45657 RepID=A0A401FRB2_9BACT|nr:sigma-54 dependent transcriptional regulator [Desulfonema ishimotonii]GBC59501.1 sigma-54-dependent Fis family transcriptional re gulator [Desulfonema ishimotonii]